MAPHRHALSSRSKRLRPLRLSTRHRPRRVACVHRMWEVASMTKPRLSRRRSFARTLAWCGIACAVALALLWVGSGWLFVGVRSPFNLHTAYLSCGWITLYWDTHPVLDSDGNGPQPWSAWCRWTTWYWDGWTLFDYGTENSASCLELALWPFALALCIPSTWILLATRRPRDPFACPHCRYPRGVGRGASPICPECGQPLPNLPHSH
jgi:hypothetical protein